MTQQSLLPDNLAAMQGRPNGHAIIHVRFGADGQAVEHAVWPDVETLGDQGMLMLQAIEKTYETKASAMLRAAVAAVMEAGMLTDISIHVDSQATIWDRFELAAAFDADTKQIHYTLIEKQTI